MIESKAQSQKTSGKHVQIGASRRDHNAFLREEIRDGEDGGPQSGSMNE